MERFTHIKLSLANCDATDLKIKNTQAFRKAKLTENVMNIAHFIAYKDAIREIPINTNMAAFTRCIHLV